MDEAVDIIPEREELPKRKAVEIEQQQSTQPPKKRKMSVAPSESVPVVNHVLPDKSAFRVK